MAFVSFTVGGHDKDTTDMIFVHGEGFNDAGESPFIAWCKVVRNQDKLSDAEAGLCFLPSCSWLERD